MYGPWLPEPGCRLQLVHVHSRDRVQQIGSLLADRDQGWAIFQSLRKYCRTAAGYAALSSVRGTGTQEDSMPSFWLAETLKYLFLLFSSNDVLPLDTWVFNTEAHPLRARARTLRGR